MKRSIEAGLFLIAALGLLFLQFHGLLGPGHYLYLAVIEDPAARLSLFPWDVLSAKELRAGHFPLWNNLSGTGMPLLANLQSSVFFPLKWLYFAWPTPRALDLLVILRLALAGTFTFVLGRALGLTRPGAAMSGLAFALSGYMMKHMNMVNVSSEMWLPLILFLMLEQKRRPSLAAFMATTLAWLMVMIGGNPEAAFYTALVAGGFALAAASDKRPARAVLLYAAPLLLGALMASVQLLPFVEYLGQGFHVHAPGLHLVAPFPPRLMGSLAAPWLMGPSGSSPLQITSAPYVGIVCLTLALLAALHPAGRSRSSLFFIGATAVLLSIIYDLPPLGWLALLPPLDRFGNVKFAMAGVTLSAAMLAGAGIDLVERGRGLGRKTAPALAVSAIILLASALVVRQKTGAFAPGGFMTPLLALLAAGVVLILFTRSAKRGGTPSARARTRAAWALVGILGLELMVLFRGFSVQNAMAPEMARFLDPSPPEALVPVMEDPGLPRFMGMAGAIHHNLNLLFGVCDLRAFDGIYPARYVKVMGEIEGFGTERARENFFSHGWSFDVAPENLVSPWLAELGVKYVASAQEINSPELTLMRDGSIKVYKDGAAWPRAWMESGNEVQPDPALPVNLKSYGEDRVVLEAEGPGTLAVSDTYFPGWRMEVDGKEQRIEPRRGLLRAVDLGPGRHEAVMTYRPWAFRIGLWAGLAGLVAMGLAAGFLIRKKSADESRRGETWAG
jgi:hypothetical protein